MSEEQRLIEEAKRSREETEQLREESEREREGEVGQETTNAHASESETNSPRTPDDDVSADSGEAAT